MNIRTIYASAMTLFALLTGYYAIMTLAFFFGEIRTEWAFPVLIAISAALIIWTAVRLWRGTDALIHTGVSLLIITGIVGLIAIPPGTWDLGFILIVLAGVASLALLAGLLSERVRKALR